MNNNRIDKKVRDLRNILTSNALDLVKVTIGRDEAKDLGIDSLVEYEILDYLSTVVTFDALRGMLSESIATKLLKEKKRKEEGTLECSYKSIENKKQ